MDASWIAAAITSIGVVSTAVYSFMGTRNSNRKDIAIAERQSISADYQVLIQELKDAFKANSEELKSNKEEMVSLRKEVKELREENLALLIENKKLNAKVEDLMERIESS